MSTTQVLFANHGIAGIARSEYDTYSTLVTVINLIEHSLYNTETMYNIVEWKRTFSQGYIN